MMEPDEARPAPGPTTHGPRPGAYGPSTNVATSEIRYVQIFSGFVPNSMSISTCFWHRCGFAPAVIYKRDRAKYLVALRRADRGNVGSLWGVHRARSRMASTGSSYLGWRDRVGFFRFRLVPERT
jgi:hypothetical protein